RHSQAHMESDVLVLTLVATTLDSEDVCATLRDDLIRAVTETGTRKVVIDFRNVRSVSSVAFRPLLSVRRIMQQVSGRMLLCNLAEPVAHMFHATRLLNADQPAAATFQELRSLADAVTELNHQGR